MLQPVIDTNMSWEHPKWPDGVHLNKKRFRRDFDAHRYPRHLQPEVAMAGGGTWNVERARKRLHTTN